MRRLKLHFLMLAVLLLGLVSFSSTASASKSGLVKSLNKFAQSDEDANFTMAEIKGKKLVIHIDDEYVEKVNENGLQSYLQDTYKQVHKYQKKNGTKLSIVFKDKASGTLAKSSSSGKGWYKHATDKEKFNFKTGQVE